MYTLFKMNKVYEKLVISGGGIKGLSGLGALQYLEDNKLLESINTYIGTSIGGIILYLLAIGYKPIEIIVYFCTNSFLTKFSVVDVISLTNGTGMYDWNIINSFLEKMTLDKIGKFLTLRELKEVYNKNLIVITYNFTNKKEEEISYINHPNMSCLVALRLSANLPLVFSRYRYLNCYYLDGGFINNLPVNLVDDIDKAIIINLVNYTNKEENESEDFKIYYYLYDLICIAANINHKKSLDTINQKDNSDIINIKSKVHAINFQINKSTQLELFSEGYQTCKEQYEQIIEKIIEEELNQ